MNDSTLNEGIAVIGMSGRFPGADDVHALWKNLCEGRESVTLFGLDQLDPSVPDRIRKDPNYVPARAVLERPEYFDAKFFGLTPREAAIMDPQHRILLETAWSALESAGYPPGTFDIPTGVFAGTSPNTYWEANLLTRPDIMETFGRYQLGLVNDRDYLATRISYKLNLTGPSLTVSTACSTSLVAVCLAFQSLQNFECDMAIAGAVSVLFPQQQGYLYQEGGIASPDGHCRPFDCKAGGTYAGAGAGIVVLKRLPDALADGDDVLAVIRGAAFNNDGSDKVGFTAPSVNGQAGAIAVAQAIAGVEPESISYVEAHGTATPIGDPIEIAALKKVFGRGPGKHCAIGSVKSNFGHLDAAAGVTGLIKTVLAVQAGTIPPSLNFSQANPEIDFDSSPFYVSSQCHEWPKRETSRRAGVSSFGMGGTNAHVILEEVPPLATAGGTFIGKLMLPLSARSEESLARLGADLASQVDRMEPAHLDRLAYTLQARRKRFDYRRFIVCGDTGEAAQLLREPNPTACGAATSSAAGTRAVLMFPGQGSQYVGMGRHLYDRVPEFRQVMQDCSEIAGPIIGESLLDVIYPSPADEEGAADKLRNTLLTQPALFAVEYALARLWMKWGAEPAAFIGHSIGEFVAAALAGVFSFEDAVRLVAHRARLMQSTQPGSMLSIRLAEEELVSRLPEGAELAAVNSKVLCVAAGSTPAIERLEQELGAEGVASTRLQTSHAFHCSLMDPIVEEFAEIVGGVKRGPVSLPFVSSTTGQFATDEEVSDPWYWGRHLRHTVRFADGIHTLSGNGQTVFLECGPRRTLGTLARQLTAGDARVRVVCGLDSGGDPASESAAVSKAIGEAWCAGIDLVWREMYLGAVPRALFSATTPFDSKQYWIEPGTASVSAATRPSSTIQPEITSTVSPAAAVNVNTAAGTADFAGQVAELVAELSGFAAQDLDEGLSFLELGLDSLLLTQLALGIRNRFSVDITFRDLMESVPSIRQVAERLANELKPAAEAPVAAAEVVRQDPPMPPRAGARLGRTPDGRAAWFVSDPDRPGKYLQLPEDA